MTERLLRLLWKYDNDGFLQFLEQHEEDIAIYLDLYTYREKEDAVNAEYERLTIGSGGWI